MASSCASSSSGCATPAAATRRWLAAQIGEIVGSPRAFGYRNQAKLVARQTGRGLLLGIYRPGSHQVVDIRQCPVHHPLIVPVLDAVAAVVERYGIPVYDERTHRGALRYVVVRVSTWKKAVQVILVTAERGRAAPARRSCARCNGCAASSVSCRTSIPTRATSS